MDMQRFLLPAVFIAISPHNIFLLVDDYSSFLPVFTERMYLSLEKINVNKSIAVNIKLHLIYGAVCVETVN